jgi:beta-lactamase regulating signal transducer with metallopeptidase domain
MSDNDQIISLLTRMEENQRKTLDTQERHLALAQAQLERSNRTIRESIELQRTSVARQKQALWVILPLVGILLVLLVYLVFKYRVL